MATEAVYGEAFRRSAGLVDEARDRVDQVRWWARQLRLALDVEA